MATKRETRQHSQLSQHGEYWHVSVSERQRSRLSGQSLRVPFLRTVLPPEVGESARAMAATARQKRSYLYHQGEFQHNYFDFVSLHHSDHDGVVRISVRHSEIVKRFNDYIIYEGRGTHMSRLQINTYEYTLVKVKVYALPRNFGTQTHL